MGFTEELFRSIEGIYSRILQHPFIRGLTDGTLDEESFKFYVVQDALYLRDFSRGLALLGARSPEDDWVVMFTQHAREAIVVERALHEGFFRGWGMTPEQVYGTPMAPVNLMYTSYLLRVAYERPFHEALGAFLPCYWIYWEVGKELERRGSPHPLYRRWIDTYASEEYGRVVREVLGVMEGVSRGLPEDQKERVRDHFITTSRLEYLFWEMGYRRQGWEV